MLDGHRRCRGRRRCGNRGDLGLALRLGSVAATTLAMAVRGFRLRLGDWQSSGRPHRHRLDRSSGGGQGLCLIGLVALGRRGQHDDLVGRAVVSVGRGHVDDLEIAGEVLEHRDGARRSFVVEGDERVVEDQRRICRLRHLADDAQARAQVELVERAVRQAAHVDPVIQLRRVDAERQRLLVDLEPPVAAARDALDVAGHALLEEARGLLHRRGLGALSVASTSS